MKKGWEIKKLGEVCEIVNGGTPKTNVTEYWDGDIHWITPADLGKLLSPIVDDTPRKISKIGLEKSSAKLFPENSVILSTRAPIGHLAINKVPMSTNQGCRGIVPGKSLSTWFLYYFLKMNVELLNSLGTGATFRELSTRALASVEIPIPPLAEQQRIVSILDECFAAIDKAKANAEQNLKNAKELFESYLQGVFESGNWEEKILGDLCTLITKGSSPKWQGINYVGTPGILFVTSENVGAGKMLLETKKYVEEKFNLKDKKSILKKGDVLTNIVGASIGRTAIYDQDDIANINQAVCILRCDRNRILNVFLMNLLNSPFLRKILHENEVNTARANLSLSFFNKLSVPCPPLHEQQSIVNKLDALRMETQKLEAVYQKKIEDLEELRKSILQRAFAGELRTDKTLDLVS